MGQTELDLDKENDKRNLEDSFNRVIRDIQRMEIIRALYLQTEVVQHAKTNFLVEIDLQIKTLYKQKNLTLEKVLALTIKKNK